MEACLEGALFAFEPIPISLEPVEDLLALLELLDFDFFDVLESLDFLDFLDLLELSDLFEDLHWERCKCFSCKQEPQYRH